MKKVRPAILTMLMLMVILSVTACGSSNSETQSSQSSTGASQSSTSAADTTTAGDETMSGETNQGIIGDVVDDVESGMHEAESGVMDQTGSSDNETSGEGTTETTR